ncbi:hypothetical protein QOZ80_2AG0126160 [Eleusine coracana subsp. coracana]|nr:hypothetical protein QOZ80_2AG0126160 [Eleusine coracana subsp. coracana]
MRIRKSASRLLGSAYSVPAAPAPDVAHPFEALTTPPPMPLQAPCSAPESFVGSSYTSPASACEKTCELSRSPWDLINDLSLSDPQAEDDLVDKYFVSVTCRASWLITSSMPAPSVRKEKQAVGTTQPRHQVPRKVPTKLSVSKGKQSEPKKAEVKKEEQEVKQPTYKCKKNDGKRWHCHRPVSHPNSLCEYHFYRKRACLDPDFSIVVAAHAVAETEMKVPQPPPAAPKPTTTSKAATGSKPRKKKPAYDFGATEGFYYYAGFAPFRSKRQCKNSSEMNESVPEKKQEEEDELAEVDSSTNEQAPSAADSPQNNKAAAHEDTSNCDDNIAGIAGVDEESSDDDYTLGVSGRSMNGNGEDHDGKRKNGWKKRWRKPVKARSLKSLM